MAPIDAKFQQAIDWGKIAILQVRALVNLAETFDSYLKLQGMEARVRKLEEQLRG